MKIYTGGGDHGKTSLLSGQRVGKGHLRVEAYGDLDELNSVIGALAAHLPEGAAERVGELRGIQRNLFDAGAVLAVAPESDSPPPTSFGVERARSLEALIDRLQAGLPPLQAFILPGGNPGAAWSHIARTVCRRCERQVVRLAESMDEPDAEPLAPVLVYLNRLSDYLFVLARHSNHANGTEEVLGKTWKAD